MLCSCMALSIMALTASHALAPLFSRRTRDICSALSARWRSGASNIGVRSSDKTCIIAWKDATPPAKVSCYHDLGGSNEPMCHWKRAASTSTDAPFMVSIQLTDFSNILCLSADDLAQYSMKDSRFADVVGEDDITIRSRHTKPEEQIATPLE